MKLTAYASSALALLLALASPGTSTAQDITGTWEITLETQRGQQTQVITLTIEDDELKGTLDMGAAGRAMAGRRGAGGGGGVRPGGGGGPQTLPLSDIRVEGDAFSFTMERGMPGGRSFSITYSGTFEGNEMTGVVEAPRGEPRPFTGKRKAD